MKIKFLFAALFCCWMLWGAGGVKAYLSPSLEYDNGLTFFHADMPTVITLIFFYQGDQKIGDIADTTRLYVEVPEKLVLSEAGLMDEWKAKNSFYTKFKTSAVKRDGKDYIRYEVPLVKNALQPCIKKPLDGGMFGGTPNNLINMMFSPRRGLDKKFNLYWKMEGKYAQQGKVPCQLVTLPAYPKKLRTEFRSRTPLKNLAYSDNMMKSVAEILRRAGIRMVSSQLPDGPNQGSKVFDSCDFQYFGGDSMGKILCGYGNPYASDDIRDYLVGLDGSRSMGKPSAAYHLRLFCATAAVTPGRLPYKQFAQRMALERKLGTKALDIDFEIQIWGECFCPDCRAWFHRFSGTKDEKLSPLELLKKYPMQWYRFRCEQTRVLYAMLKKHAPEIKIGADAIIHEFGKDLDKDLKWGICSFGEDPRLLGKSIDYVLADTLVGGVYDGISVDAMKKSVNVPIIAVAGSSYCVGFGWGVMPARRMTAEMTGAEYGYEERPLFHKLSMLHLLASGASGLRLDISSPEIALSTVEAGILLTRIEDFYLDGKRVDKLVEVCDLTDEPSLWQLDKSRIRGGIWKYFYDRYCGQVQYRVHKTEKGLLISLFNWDPHQTKKWHLRTAGAYKNAYVTDMDSMTAIFNGKKSKWSAKELADGFDLEIKPYGYRIFLLSDKAQNTTGTVNIKSSKTTEEPYDQYAWRSGETIDIRKVMEKEIVRPLRMLKLYGGKTLRRSVRPLPVKLPFVSDFSRTQNGFNVFSRVDKNMLHSEKRYHFGDIFLPASEKPLEVIFELKGTEGSVFASALYSIKQNKMPDKMLFQAEKGCSLRGDFIKHKLIIPAKYLKQTVRLYYYNKTRVPEIIIKSISVKTAE